MRTRKKEDQLLSVAIGDSLLTFWQIWQKEENKECQCLAGFPVQSWPGPWWHLKSGWILPLSINLWKHCFKSFFNYLFKNISFVFMCGSRGMCDMVFVWTLRTICWSWFSPSTTWILRTKIRSSCLAVSTFIYWFILQSLKTFLQTHPKHTFTNTLNILIQSRWPSKLTISHILNH